MPDKPKRPLNPTAAQIHEIETRYAVANSMMDTALAALKHDMPIINAAAGLSDASILFDYVLSFIRHRHQVDPTAFVTTEIMCAAAFTKLAQGSSADDILAQYENEVSGDNDNRS
jgi:phage gp36-like protein